MVLWALAAPTPDCRAELASGLIAYWPFDGTAEDVSGGHYDLALSSTQFVPGLVGQALNFLGVPTQSASRPVDDHAFNFGAGDFTIQLWVRNYWLRFPEEVEMTLIEKFSGDAGPGWTLTSFVSPSSVTLHFAAPGAAWIFSDPVTISLGQWLHVIARRAGQQVQILANNVPVATGNDAVVMSASNLPLLMGRRNDNDGRGFALIGWLDEVAIWNRALSAAEVSELYNGGAGRSLFKPNLFGDLNGDDAVNNLDIAPFALALTRLDLYQQQYSGLDPVKQGDINRDGFLANTDIAPFAALLTGGQAGSATRASVAEPASILLAVMAIALLAAQRAQHTSI